MLYTGVDTLKDFKWNDNEKGWYATNWIDKLKIYEIGERAEVRVHVDFIRPRKVESEQGRLKLTIEKEKVNISAARRYVRNKYHGQAIIRSKSNNEFF